MERFAKARCQRIYAFRTYHTRPKPTGSISLRLCVGDSLHQLDQGSKFPLPGLFLYTSNMPSVILTQLGLVNGATKTAVGIVVDPAGESLSFAH